MLDTRLSIEAKAVYAYFCAFSGSGTTAFPGRERILDDLSMSKDSYYRHYRQLTDGGYISVSHEKDKKARFTKNIYTLVSMPEGLSAAAKSRSSSMEHAEVYVSGLKSGGYGMIAKAVMTDRRLSVKAKALYAFYAAFTGAGNGAFPSQDMLHHYLGISANSCRKYNKELLAVNYIQVIQRHVNGRLSVNDVILIDNPDIENAETRHVIRKAGECSAEKQFTKNKDTELDHSAVQLRKKQDTEKQDVKIQDAEKQDAIKTNPQNKQKNIINSSHYQQSDSASTRYRLKKKETAGERAEKKYSAAAIKLQDECIDAMARQGTLCEQWLGNRKYMKAALEILTEDGIKGTAEYWSGYENGEMLLEIFEAYRDALIYMLSSKKKLVINGESVSPQDIYGYFIRLVVLDTATPDLYIEDMFEEISASVAAAAERREIRNLSVYMRSCIYNFLVNESELGI